MTTNQRLTAFLESSFLSELLQVPTVTDISFNGEALYYEDSALGRQKYEKEIANSAVGDFLRQIANFSDKQFSYMNPILDVSFSRYRLNATFLSIVRVKDERAYSHCVLEKKEAPFWMTIQSFGEGLVRFSWMRFTKEKALSSPEKPEQGRRNFKNTY